MNHELPLNPVSADDKTFGMLAHLLALFTGFIGPLVIWLIKKDGSSFVDQHGKEALNFQISVTIYYIISCVLMFLLIGFVLIFAVAVFNLVVCIIAAVKAYNGEIYSYPLCIRFIS